MPRNAAHLKAELVEVIHTAAAIIPATKPAIRWLEMSRVTRQAAPPDV